MFRGQVKRHRRGREQSLRIIYSLLLPLVDCWKRGRFFLGLMCVRLGRDCFLVKNNRARFVSLLLLIRVGPAGRPLLNLLEALSDAVGDAGCPLWVPLVTRRETRRRCVVVGVLV